jgi:predicted N-acetyltransferase YhbS
MFVRKITEKDIDALAEFEKEIALISFGDEAVTDLNHHRKRISKSLEKEDDGMLVLCEGDEVVGWLWMSLQTNSVSLEKYINFRSFYVKNRPELSQGSEMLMSTGLDFARKTGARRVVGKTFVSNLPMRLVYKKFNFKPTHITMELSFDD